jgi:hypothetical protein
MSANGVPGFPRSRLIRRYAMTITVKVMTVKAINPKYAAVSPTPFAMISVGVIVKYSPTNVKAEGINAPNAAHRMASSGGISWPCSRILYSSGVSGHEGSGSAAREYVGFSGIGGVEFPTFFGRALPVSSESSGDSGFDNLRPENWWRVRKRSDGSGRSHGLGNLFLHLGGKSVTQRNLGVDVYLVFLALVPHFGPFHENALLVVSLH